MPNRTIVKRIILIITLLSCYIIPSLAQNYTITDNTDGIGMRTIKTSSVEISHEIGQFYIDFLYTGFEGVHTITFTIKCRQCTSAWYVDKGSYAVLEHPDTSTYCMAVKEAKPQVNFNREENRAYFDYDAEFMIPHKDLMQPLAGITSCTFQLRNSSGQKIQVHLPVPELVKDIYQELITQAGL